MLTAQHQLEVDVYQDPILINESVLSFYHHLQYLLGSNQSWHKYITCPDATVCLVWGRPL